MGPVRGLVDAVSVMDPFGVWWTQCVCDGGAVMARKGVQNPILGWL